MDGALTNYCEEHVTSDYLYIVLRLRWLEPDIIAAIVNGRQPPKLNAKRLMRVTAQLPADWSDANRVEQSLRSRPCGRP